VKAAKTLVLEQICVFEHGATKFTLKINILSYYKLTFYK